MKVQEIDINWNPDLSIYASESFLKAVGDDYGWLGGFNSSGKLCCILPYTIIRKAIFSMVRFRIETILIDHEITVEEEKSFLNNVVEYFRTRGADMIIPATTNSIFRTYPDGAIAAPYGSYIIDLTKSEEFLWNQMNTTYRKKIRNSLKKGVEISTGFEYLDESYELLKNALKVSGVGFMRYKEFKRMISGFGEYVKFFVAYYQGTLQGCTIFPFSNYSAYSLYGGRIPEAETGAMNLLNWEAIQQFREHGVKCFDFVGVRINPEKGSKQEGIMTFKQRFGGSLFQGYMWKYSIRPLKYFVYAQAVRYVRGGDIVDAECHKLINNDKKIGNANI
ncbi:MAG: peptidoglycan bridge formation glycyltransferase FemA/FemB family protein [Smithella sp.]|jgi:hypothetical protein